MIQECAVVYVHRPLSGLARVCETRQMEDRHRRIGQALQWAVYERECLCGYVF